MNVREALEHGCDAVAVHVNVTSEYASEMLQSLSDVLADSRRYGLPVLAIMYPRGETSDGSDENYIAMRESEPDGYTALIAHAVRIAVDLGAAIVKTHYTGSAASFARVVEAAGAVPVLISGGPLADSESMLRTAAEAVSAGAAGVSFGRNVFSRNQPWRMIRALKDVVLNGASPDEAQSRHTPQ
jgi:DhnA family fructose-bisphosphate aldolase class Ia